MTQDSLPSHMRQPAQRPARVLLASPTLADVEVVTELMRAYAPDRLVASRGVDVAIVEACGRALGIEIRQFDGELDTASILNAAAADGGQGSALALLVPPEAWPAVMTDALGISRDAEAHIAFVSSAISVLECDADGQWAAVRVNEGAWPPAVD